MQKVRVLLVAVLIALGTVWALSVIPVSNATSPSTIQRVAENPTPTPTPPGGAPPGCGPGGC